ncbi:MAG: hypothetical protein LBH78_02810 [Rickettsiales bacterium]|jgi:hypothetical protein|nr:hypothetical protein [Rickettsiales bacterium]
MTKDKPSSQQDLKWSEANGKLVTQNQESLENEIYGTDEHGKKLAEECAESVLSDGRKQNSQKCIVSSRSFYSGNRIPNVVYSEWPEAGNYADGSDDQEVLKDHWSTVQQQVISDWSNKSVDSSNFNSEECNSDDSSVLEESSSLVEQKLPLTEDEKKMISGFLEKIEEVTKKNDQEYKESLINPNINWTKSALVRIKHVTDKYLEKGIRLNSCCDGCDETVTNSIFEKIIDILDSTTNTTSGSEALGFGPGNRENEETKDENISVIHSIVSNLLLRGGKVKQRFFDYDRIAHSTAAFIDDNFRERFDKYFPKQSEEEESKPVQFHEYFSERRKKTKDRLKKIVSKSVTNKCDEEKGEAVKAIEYGYNEYLYVKYSQDSIIEVAKVINDSEVRSLEGVFKLSRKKLRSVL